MQLAACHNTRGCLPKVLVVPEAGDSDEVDSRSASAPLRADSTGLITAGAAAEVVWHCSYSFEKVKRALSNTGTEVDNNMKHRRRVTTGLAPATV